MNGPCAPKIAEKRYTVLLIDDSPEDRATYRRYLQRDTHHVYNILEADSATIGLKLYQSVCPDIILLDYGLPDLDGLSLLKLFMQQDRKPGVPTLMLTGQGSEAIATQAMKNGAQDYLVKGILTADILCRTIIHTIEQFQLQQQLLRQQQQSAIVAEITLRIRRSLDLREILQTTVDEVRQFLQTDRVIIFRFTANWGGTVVVESVEDAAWAILQSNIYDPCIGEQYVEPFKQGRVTAKADIYNADISPCHVEFLAQFHIRANLVVPILKNNELWGLLAAHHCTAPRQWQESEIDLLQQIAAQVSIALQQAELFEQVQAELKERQQAEATLQEQESLLRLFVQYAPAGIAMFDREMRYVMASQQWVDEYHLDRVEALINRSHYDLFPEIPERWRQLHQRCLAGATERCEEDLLVRMDGTSQWISWEIRPWYTAIGDIGGIIIFSVDVTHRKRTEESLRQSEARLRLAQTASSSAVWDWDIQANTLIWSPEFYQLYNLDPQTEPSYENWLSCIHPVDRETINQRTLQALEDQSSGIRLEFRVLHANQIRWFAGIGQIFRNDAGNPVRMIGISIDITQQKQTELALQELNANLEQRVTERTAELTALSDRLLVAYKEQAQIQAALQESEERRRLALDITRIGFWDWHLPTGKIIWDDNHFMLLGLTPNSCEPSYELWRSHIHPEDRGWVEQQFFDAIQTQTEYVVEYRVLYSDGSVHWLMMRAKGIYDEAGQLLRSLGVLLDISDLKQAEQKLALQAVITRNMAEGICLVRADNATVVYANPKFEQMFGYAPGELNGQPISLVNYGSESVTAEQVSQAIRSAVLQNSEATYEIHNVKKDGTPFWCNATCSMFNHPDYGDVLVAVHQDITDRKEAEAALQQQTQLEHLRWEITQSIRQSLDLKAILNTTVYQIRQTLQVDRVVVYRFWPDWSGNFIAESVSDNWVKLVDDEVQKVWEDTHLQATQGGRFQNHEVFVVPDIYTAGLQACHIDLLKQFQAKAYAVVPIFAGETLWGLLAIYQNVTARDWQAWEMELLQQVASQLSIALQQSELYSQLQLELQERQQTEAGLREAERRWQSLLDNVQLVVIGLDIDGKVEYANPFFLSLTGYQLEEVLGKYWFGHFLASYQKSSPELVFQEILECNSYPHYQNPIVTKAGEERMIAWNNTALQNSSGQIIGVIGIGEDITERNKVDRMKAEFIAVVSHELRTPLTSMQAALSLLNEKIINPLSEEGEATIQIAAEGTDRLVRLVNDILDLERLESGKVRLEKHLYNLDDLVNTAVGQMQEMANQAGIELEVNPCHFQVEVDGDRLIQVFTNLLSNAIKFSFRDSTVQLSVKPQYKQQVWETPASLLFTLCDHGRGIPVDQLESIFDRFHQIDASDSRKKGGTGLGLAICRSIVQQHGGEIWAESTLEQGSRFYFTIPMAGAERQELDR